MTYYALMAKEFPDYDQATLPPLPEGWEDVSWHNDTCPSFFVEDAKLTVHIAEANPAEREFPEGLRYCVLWAGEDDPLAFSLCTDDWQEVLDHAAERACPRLHGAHRDTGRGVCAHCGKVL